MKKKKQGRWELKEGVLGEYASFVLSYKGKKIKVQFSYGDNGQTIFRRFPL